MVESTGMSLQFALVSLIAVNDRAWWFGVRSVVDSVVFFFPKMKEELDSDGCPNSNRVGETTTSAGCPTFRQNFCS